MRWAYSGSMRPEFKVLACELLGRNFVYCNQRVAFDNDFEIWTSRCCSRPKPWERTWRLSTIRFSSVALSVRTIEAERHRGVQRRNPR